MIHTAFAAPLRLPSLLAPRRHAPHAARTGSGGAGGDGNHKTAHPEPVEGPVSASTLRIAAELIALRQRQIEHFGHTAEADRARPMAALPIAASQALAKIHTELRGGIDYAQFHKPELARRYLVKAAALILAAIERIDAETETESLTLPESSAA
jgi:hypothetical protein